MVYFHSFSLQVGWDANPASHRPAQSGVRHNTGLLGVWSHTASTLQEWQEAQAFLRILPSCEWATHVPCAPSHWPSPLVSAWGVAVAERLASVTVPATSGAAVVDGAGVNPQVCTIQLLLAPQCYFKVPGSWPLQVVEGLFPCSILLFADPVCLMTCSPNFLSILLCACKLLQIFFELVREWCNTINGIITIELVVYKFQILWCCLSTGFQNCQPWCAFCWFGGSEYSLVL